MKVFKFLLPVIFCTSLVGCNENVSVKTYKVTWLNNNKDVLKIENELKENAHPIFDMPNPSSGVAPSEGHHFVFTGWKDEDGINYDDSYLIKDHDVVFTANYQSVVNVHEVKWINDNGDTIDDEVWSYGSHPFHVVPIAQNEPSEGHHFEFINWMFEETEYTEDFQMPDHDIELKAKYIEVPNVHIVHWINDNGEEIDSNSWDYGSHPTHEIPTSKKEPPTGFHYLFSSWKSNDDELYSDNYLMPDHDVTFTAIFELRENVHIVTWLNDNGEEIDHNSWKYGLHPHHTVPEPVLEPSEGHHFVFDNWISPDGDVYSDSYLMPDKDVTFKASFKKEANVHTIYWLNDNDAEIDSSRWEYGVHPTHDIPMSSLTPTIGHHYAFTKWTSVMGDYTDSFLMPDKDVTFKANYVLEANTHTIKWELPNGKIDTTYIKYGETPTHKDAEKAPDVKQQETYFFVGWYDGEVKLDSNYKVTGDVTFKPKFDIVPIGGCDYELNETNDGYVAIRVNEHYVSTDLTILDTYKGLPVVAIKNEAFKNDYNFLNVRIGKNVEIIGDDAFYYTYIKTVSFTNYTENKLVRIGDRAFYGTELETFKAPANLMTIGYSAFETSKSTLQTVDFTLPDHVVGIANNRVFGMMPDWFKVFVKNKEMVELYKQSWPSDFYDRLKVQGGTSI